MRAMDAIVTGKGVRFNPKTNVQQWGVCPPLKSTPQATEELKGRKFGRLTVLGMSAHLSARWIVRCSCGMHEARRATVIKRAEPWDCCAECLKVLNLRAKHQWRTTGTQPDWRDYASAPKEAEQPQAVIKSLVPSLPAEREACPPLRIAPGEIAELIGARAGRLTVIGLSADPLGHWVCLCACGAYESRRAKQIRNPKAGDCCQECQEVRAARKPKAQRTEARPTVGINSMRAAFENLAP